MQLGMEWAGRRNADDWPPSWGESIAFDWDLGEERTPRLYLARIKPPYH